MPRLTRTISNIDGHALTTNLHPNPLYFVYEELNPIAWHFPAFSKRTLSIPVYYFPPVIIRLELLLAFTRFHWLSLKIIYPSNFSLTKFPYPEDVKQGWKIQMNQPAKLYFIVTQSLSQLSTLCAPINAVLDCSTSVHVIACLRASWCLVSVSSCSGWGFPNMPYS